VARVVVFGNEKGGSGKTTTAMHTITYLMLLGFKVASLDLDLRQASLTRYIENREKTKKEHGIELKIPFHSTYPVMVNGQVAPNQVPFHEFLSSLMNQTDFLIIDTPGSYTEHSCIAHSYADLVVTPMNDSFLDLDLIGKINPNNLEVVFPGVYSAMLFSQKLERAARDRKEIDWVLVRNRLSSLEAINKRNVESALQKLSKKMGFRIVPGFGDRVIFKELFLYGLTLLDAGTLPVVRITPSVLAARQELRTFISTLGLIKESNTEEASAL